MLIRNRSVMLFVAGTLLGFFLFSGKWNTYSSFEITHSWSPSQQRAFNTWNEISSCIEEKLRSASSEKIWYKFHEYVRDCIESTPAIHLLTANISLFKNKDENKYHIFMDPKVATKLRPDDCTILSLGVGRDIQAEKSLKPRLMAGCKFFGADPITEENGDLYQSIGEFFPVAVGSKTQVMEANVLDGEGMNDYSKRKLIHIDFVSFVNQIVNRQVIDNIFMDVEGAEYDLLPQFLKGREVETHGITVCQLNAEMHDARNDESKQRRYATFVRQLLHDRRWVIANAEDSGSPHRRLFLLNLASKLCHERYFGQFFQRPHKFRGISNGS